MSQEEGGDKDDENIGLRSELDFLRRLADILSPPDGGAPDVRRALGAISTMRIALSGNPRSSVAANKDEPSELVKRISAYSYADADTVAKLEREAAEWKRKFYGEAVDRAPRSATAEFETWFKAEFTYGDGTAEPPHDDSFKDMLRGAWDAGAASRPAISTLASADVDVGQQPWSGSICSCGKSTLNGPVSCATKDCPMAKLGGYVEREGS